MSWIPYLPGICIWIEPWLCITLFRPCDSSRMPVHDDWALDFAVALYHWCLSRSCLLIGVCSYSIQVYYTFDSDVLLCILLTCWFYRIFFPILVFKTGAIYETYQKVRIFYFNSIKSKDRFYRIFYLSFKISL